MRKSVASLSILLVIALFYFLSVGLATADSYTYTLSGGSLSGIPLVVDDDLEVKVNGKTVFIDDDGVSTYDGRATWKGAPITFSASPGEVLQIIATNPGGVDIELSELYLHVNGQSLKLSDGVPKTQREEYKFFDESFTISIPTPKVSILDYSPSPVHGEEDLNVKVSWSNSPNDWKLIVSLEKSDVDYTRLADEVSKKVSGSGEETFTLKVYPTTGIHVQAKVCACFYNEKGELKILDKKGIIVYPKYIILIAIISLILLLLIAYRKGKKKSKPPEEIGKKATEEVKIPEPKEGKEKLNFPENEIKQHEATISEPEDMEGVLKGTYPEKDAARLASAFRIAQDLRNNYCDTNTKAKDINKEFDLLKMYLNEKEFLDVVEGIQRRINAELREDERLSEKHVEEVKNFCEKFTEMWIAKFLR